MRKKTFCIKPNRKDCDAFWKDTRVDVCIYDVIWDSEEDTPKLYEKYQRARRGLEAPEDIYRYIS